MTLCATNRAFLRLLAAVFLGICGLVIACAINGQAPTQPTYEAPSTGRTLIRAGAVLDVRSGKEMRDATVIVAGEKVVGVTATASTPAGSGDREVDLREETVLPG